MNEIKKSVLIVDDYPNWRDIFTRLLRKKYNVTSVGSYQEAQEALSRQSPPFHTVVMDVRLVDSDTQDKSGLRLILDEIRRKGISTNVIVVTGYHSEATKGEADYLDVFAYILKYPPGKEFDRQGFKETLDAAVENVEEKRLCAQQSTRVLIVEEDDSLRRNLKHILENESYSVDEAASVQEWEDKLMSQQYKLVLLQTTLLPIARNALAQTRKNQEQTKIVLTAEDKLEAIVQAILRNRYIEDIISINHSTVNIPAIKETIQQALYTQSVKYVTAQVIGCDERISLQLGESYWLSLQLQNKPEPGSLSVWLPPNRQKTTLTVTVDAPGIKIQPGGKIPWDISLQDIPPVLKLEMLPKSSKTTAITFDMYYGKFWLGRLEKRVNIIERVDNEQHTEPVLNADSQQSMKDLELLSIIDDDIN